MSNDKSIPISSAALEAFARASGSSVPERNQTDADASMNERSDEKRFPVTVLPGFCTRLAGSSCERCTYACPYDAISFDAEGRPHIDPAYCTHCGLCCGMCDAFVTERITMNDLLDKVRRLAADGEPVFFTCYDHIPEDFEVHPNVIVLPCIGAVAPEFWASALRIASDVRIYCDFTLCAECPIAGNDARALFTHAVNLGEIWSQVHMGRADRLPEKTDLLSRFVDAASDEYQRRNIATSLINEVEDITSGKHRKRNSDTLTNYHTRKEHMRAQGHAQNIHHREHVPSTAELPIRKEWPRLHMIANAVQEHPEIASNIPRYLAAVDDDLCVHCYETCFSHCPAGARSLNDDATIAIDPLLCIACGNCALHCPHDAAYLYETDASVFLIEDAAESTDETSMTSVR